MYNVSQVSFIIQPKNAIPLSIHQKAVIFCLKIFLEHDRRLQNFCMLQWQSDYQIIFVGIKNTNVANKKFSFA